MGSLSIRKTGLLKSAALLSAFSLLCKLSGMFFRLYLTGRIGAEGVGLYQLIMSVYSLFSTFATAGFSVSVSRLTAEAFENPDIDEGRRKASRIMNASILLSLLIGCLSLIVMFSMSGVFANTFLDDSRTFIPLRILAMSMPFMSLSSCFKGFFIAARRIKLPASAQLFEQLAKISISYLFISVFYAETTDLGLLCTGIVAGLAIGELLSFLYLYVFYLFSSDRFKKWKKQESRLYKYSHILRVTMPIAANSYITGLLHTFESILIPYCFSLFGGDKVKSLAEFGLIRGMVIPMLFFPFAFLQSVISILIPEISRLNTFQDKTMRDNKIEKILRMTFIFSIAAGGIFFFLPDEISTIFYGSTEASYTLRLLAIVTPFMYIETIADGMLKGIGEQMFTLKTSIINSVARIIIIVLMIPKTGSDGYLWLLIISNTFAFFMCVLRIKKVTSIKLEVIKNCLLPFVYTAAAGFAARYILGFIKTDIVLVSGIVGCLVFAAVYGLLYLVSYKYGRKNI